LRALSELRGAISFLTVIPVGGGIEEAVRGVYWFPAVGAMVGLIAGLASTATASALPGLMVGVVGVAVTLLLTGLHHLDGLVDLGDGLMAHGPPEVRLKAMRDSRMGAGGFALALMVTLASIASIASAPTSALVPIMAGGRGTRMGGHVEKPLVEVRGVPMLDRVVEALRGAEAVRRVIVVASRHTPSTYARALRLGVEAFMGRGAGYVEDLHMAVRWAGLKGPILVAPCDLPLIDSEVVDLVAQCYLRRSRSPAMSVAVPHSLVELLGLRPSYVVEVSGLKVALSGVNVVEASRVGFKQIAEEVLVVEDRPPQT